MSEEQYYSKHYQDLEEHFRSVRNSSVHHYEKRMAAIKREMTDKDTEAALTTMHSDVMTKMSIKPEELEQLEKKNDERLETILEKQRNNIIEREVDLEEGQRERVIRTDYYNQFRCIQPSYVGSDLITTEDDIVKRASGTTAGGNPALWYNEPLEIHNVKVVANGRWPHGACGGRFVLKGADTTWYWTFTPTQTTLYWIIAVLPYHGFYLLKSNDGFWTCKYAMVKCFTSFRLHQTQWLLEQWDTAVVNRREKNVITTVPLDGAATWDNHIQLIANEPVTIAITMTKMCFAKGGGTKAELNFSDGVPHYLGPPQVLVMW